MVTFCCNRGLFALVFLIYMSTKARKELNDILGEGGKVTSPLRFMFGLAIAIPIWFFVLLFSKEHNTVPSTVEFNIITVSGLLGGLVIAAARSHNNNDPTYKELISIGQKFILAMILLILFAVGYFMQLQVTGEVDINQFEFSNQGIARGVSFWLMLPCFYGGTSIFALALVDLMVTLRNIGRSV
jgi:hypothetical protein